MKKQFACYLQSHCLWLFVRRKIQTNISRNPLPSEAFSMWVISIAANPGCTVSV